MIAWDIVLQAGLSGLLMGCAYAFAAVGFTIVFGVMNIANFAHGHVIMAAMFTGWCLDRFWGLSPYLAAPLVFVLFLVLGQGLYRIVIRPIIGATHIAQLLTTLGLLIILENLANLIFGGDLRSVPRPFGGASLQLGTIHLPWTQLIAAGGSLAAVASVWAFFRFTRFGSQIRAAADNRTGALVSGVPIDRVFRWAFGIAMGTAALAGVMLVPAYLISPFVGYDFMLKGFVIAIIGGLGSLPGALAAGLLIGVVEAGSGLFMTASLGTAVVFGLLLITLLVRPSGLFGKLS